MKFTNYLFLFAAFLFASSCESEVETFKPMQNFDLEDRQERWTGFTLINPCEAGGLTYAIESICGDYEYIEAVHLAVEEYNQLSSISIYFTEVSPEDNPDVIFRCINFPNKDCVSARAATPLTVDNPGSFYPTMTTSFETSGGIIGGEVHLYISEDFCNCDENPNNNQIEYDEVCENENITPLDLVVLKARTVMHEIGHVLGIAHNGQSCLTPENEEDYELIDNTPDVVYDPNSIFNGWQAKVDNCVLCTAPAEFNNNDIITLSTLYPACDDPCPRPTFENSVDVPKKVCDGDYVLMDIGSFLQTDPNAIFYSNAKELIISGDHLRTGPAELEDFMQTFVIIQVYYEWCNKLYHETIRVPIDKCKK